MNSSDTTNISRLRHLLALEDWYMSDATREWLAQTPPEQAVNILARIADEAQPEPHSLLPQVAGGFAAVFATSENVGIGGVVSRRVGTRAALMLADMGDVRCLPPLLRVFETSATWQGKYQELVETTLTRFLAGAVGRSDLRNYDNDLRKLVERVWNMGRGASELSTNLTELLLAALSCLRALRGPHNLAVIRAIAGVPGTNSNRLKVKETAQKLLNS